jgi:hypothetical protein
MLTGFNPWILGASALVLGGSGFGLGYTFRGNQEGDRAAIVAEAVEKARIEAVDAALAAQKIEHDKILADAIDQERKAAQRKRAGVALEKEIRDAPVTEACAASPAIDRALDGLRALEAARARDLHQD